MRESTFYQAILEEGRQEGRQQGRQEGLQEGLQEGEKRGIEKGMRKGYVRLLRKIVPLLQSAGIPIAPVLNLAGVTLAELEGQEEDDSEMGESANL